MGTITLHKQVAFFFYAQILSVYYLFASIYKARAATVATYIHVASTAGSQQLSTGPPRHHAPKQAARSVPHKRHRSSAVKRPG